MADAFLERWSGNRTTATTAVPKNTDGNGTKTTMTACNTHSTKQVEHDIGNQVAIKSQENEEKKTGNDMATNKRKNNNEPDIQRPIDSVMDGQGNGNGNGKEGYHQHPSATRQCPPTHHIDGKTTLTKDATGQSDREETKRHGES